MPLFSRDVASSLTRRITRGAQANERRHRVHAMLAGAASFQRRLLHRPGIGCVQFYPPRKPFVLQAVHATFTFLGKDDLPVT